MVLGNFSPALVIVKAIPNVICEYDADQLSVATEYSGRMQMEPTRMPHRATLQSQKSEQLRRIFSGIFVSEFNYSQAFVKNNL